MVPGCSARSDSLSSAGPLILIAHVIGILITVPRDGAGLLDAGRAHFHLML